MFAAKMFEQRVLNTYRDRVRPGIRVHTQYAHAVARCRTSTDAAALGLPSPREGGSKMADMLTRELIEEEEAAERAARDKEAKRLAKLERKRCETRFLHVGRPAAVESQRAA